MKKLIFSILAIVLINFNGNAALQVNPTVQKFITSNDYLKNKAYLSKYGEIDFDKVVVNRISEKGKTYDTFVLPFYKNALNTAIVEVVDIAGTKKLPNNESYGMNLIDFTAFNFKSFTGNVNMYDLNYEKNLHSQIEIENNKIMKWIANGLPQELKDKYFYTNVNVPELIILNTVTNNKVPLDSNNDGNLSFSECYAGFSEAIEADGFSSWVCDIPILGWGACFTSVSVSCVILSSYY